LDTGDSVDSLEEVCTTCGVLDVGVDEKGVGLGMDVLPVGQQRTDGSLWEDLHHDLETVEALGFGGLDLRRESLDKVLVDDTVRLDISLATAGEAEATYSSKESEDVLDEVSFVVIELVVPIVEIGGKVDFLGCPEPDCQFGSKRESET
jgi:hypothetical protein